ncbi:putative hydroxymethylpyrimidine transporter CytX [Candidatus Formimonas warabiya]|uniref:Cytosine permease n=1 Tax=Formimonas warabiya TaxID=1761012 RepID=A0A3G1KUE1_FORW1|nr:putative hydroxymethylpyrimidine transporter CytX [Candidatus Formimonas warabiya]ATW26061.1 cytosine permease [Candidatus Formimonas warabiya]
MPNNSQNNITALNFAFLWFGAAVSIAEIMTGGLLAPLGFQTGIGAIIAGHLMGTTILVLGGIIGTEERIPALASTRISFGTYGSYLFSGLNVLQLLGWTAVMIMAGARSVNQITKTLWSFDHIALWSVVIGLLICLWIWTGKEGWKKWNLTAVFALFILTILLSLVVFQDDGIFTKRPAGSMTLGTAIELNVIMPLSWLPLIADYTRFARHKRDGAWGSWLGYFTGSCWMYIIGLGTAIAAENSDITAMMLVANLGFVALGIVILSTVTTTFLDAYSAGVTFLNFFPKLPEKTVALVMGGLGTILALLVNMEQYENFLYAIGSVFAPLFAIVLTDYFILKNKKADPQLMINWNALLVWILGIVLYYQFIKFDLILGATAPVMACTGGIYLLTWRCTKTWKCLKVSQKTYAQ